MKLYFMEQDMIDKIKGDFSSYLPYYRGNDLNWFNHHVFSHGGLVESKIKCKDFTLDTKTGKKGEMKPEDYNVGDLINIKLVYDHLKDVLTPQQACDERLWAGLTHSHFWDYVQFRRASELKGGNEEKIKFSFFYSKNGIRRASDVHCVSRLWWAGYYTYDEKDKQNPYHLTDFFFKEAVPSRMVLLSSRSFAHNKEICLGLLSALKERSEKGELLTRKIFECALRYLNGAGSVTVLDALSRDDIREMVAGVLAKNFGKL